ncbi:MAG: outer membrane beta-barrel protein [Spirochaetaceae bacterium]|jgi:hypothetical protein|nr:outer membrane beta-barrel protein [Spirochaetaceae bacterium]
MKYPRAAAWLLLFLLCGFVEAQEYSLGVSASLYSSLGTDKGFWDNIDDGENFNRLFLPSPSFTIFGQYSPRSSWAMQLGLSYYENTCAIEIEGETFLFRQPTVEIPIRIKLFHLEGPWRPYSTLGIAPALFLPEASFQSDTQDLLSSKTPGNSLHVIVNLGLGMEYRKNNHHWNLAMIYSTFYSSPEYNRMDGTAGDIRFHRFELVLGYVFNL